MPDYFAPAKLNFGLSVLGARADGFHELHSIMVPLSVGDELSIEAAPTLSLTVHGADLPGDERNLVFRAARAYLDAAGVQAGAAIVLHKQLPLASGLGGGSSDAATTLMALSRLYPAPELDVQALALKLGADVPFFLLGHAALAEGVGERLTPLPLPRLHLVLAHPGTAISARDAYHWLDDEEGFTPRLDVEALVEALGQTRELPYFNALQGPVLAHHPELKTVLSVLSGLGLSSPLMSGSGSSCFALARSDDQADQAARVLKSRHPDWWVRAAYTL